VRTIRGGPLAHVHGSIHALGLPAALHQLVPVLDPRPPTAGRHRLPELLEFAALRREARSLGTRFNYLRCNTHAIRWDARSAAS
jgi:hypothetical protein